MVADPVDLAGKKVLITGVTGQVAKPLVAAYARTAQVYALARYTDEGQMASMKAVGATPVKADLTDATSLLAVPEDIDYVIHCAVVKSGDFPTDLAGNGEGVGNLIARCRRAKAFLHMSTTGVYEYEGHAPRKETSKLGDNHKSMLPTYSISKIAAETVCRFAAHHFGVPTTIARLNVPYGDFGCWPYMHLMQMQAGQPIAVHPERPNNYCLLHSDDYIDKIPRLLAVATPAVTLTNFGGSQRVSIEEWSAYMGELTGLKPSFIDFPGAFGSLEPDLTRMHELIGPTKVDWHDGIRRMVTALAPGLLKG